MLAVGNARRWPPGWWHTAKWHHFRAQTKLLRIERNEDVPEERRFRRTGDPSKRRAGRFGAPPSAEVLAQLPTHTADT